MRADIFVHPTWSTFIGNTATPSVKEYEQELRKKAKQCKLGALVVSVHEGERSDVFRDLLPEERTFISGGIPTGRSEVEDCGAVIDPEEFNRLVTFVKDHNIDTALVHGSYLSMCTQGFAMQLYGIIHGLDIAIPGQTFEEADAIVARLNRDGGMYGGGVELGDVLRPLSYDPSPMIAGVVRLRHGLKTDNSVAHLYGPETRIFEMIDTEEE